MWCFSSAAFRPSGRGADSLRGWRISPGSGSSFRRVWINDHIVGETQLNAAYAGHFGVPVGLITGDLALRTWLEEENVLRRARYVVTKEALARAAIPHQGE